MNLLQMSSYICNQTGVFDNFNLTLTKAFVDKEYRMVFDSYFWRDSQMNAAALLSAGVKVIPYPASMDRVVSVRAGGDHFLDPIESTFLIESDPTIFERTGIPLYYEETTDLVTGAKTLVVYPTPAVETNFFIVGKRICPGMTNDSDVSILRNTDNAIIAFATFDLLQKLRQWGKAKDKLTEAQSLLQLAQSVEKDQANQPRRHKALTVAGNSLSELTDGVCAVCNLWTPDVVILARQFLRRNYQAFYDLTLWPESTVGVNVPFDNEQVILPDYVDRVIGVRGAKQFGLVPVEVTTIIQLNPAVFEQTGEPISFSILTPVAVSVLPPASEALVFSSTDPSDVSKIFVKGESGGAEIYEEIVLNGVVPVVSAHVYDVPLTIAKDITAGDVTVNGASSNLLLEVLGAGEREKKHVRLWLLPPPASSDLQNCIVLAKRKIKPLLTDQDTPLITGCQQVLIAAASADVLSRVGDSARADEQRKKADASTKVLLSLNTDQSAYMPRFIPHVEPYAYSQDRSF